MRITLPVAIPLLALVAACGRIGYEPLPADAAGGDGAAGIGGSGGIGGDAGAGGSGGVGGGGGGSGPGGGGGASGAGAGGGGGASGAGAGGGAGASGGGGAAGRGGAGGTAGSGGTSGPAGASGAGGSGGSGGSSGAAGAAGQSGAGGAACPTATFGGHSYAFCEGPLPWTDAAADCAAKAMRLVRIDDAAENAFVLTTAFAGITSTSSIYWPWIGGNDRAVLGEWRWSDGALFWIGGSNGSAQGGLYNNWVAGSPTSGGGATDCAIMQHGTFWTDFDCARLQRYVCEQY